MNRFFGLVVVLASPVGLLADDAADVRAELKALEGTWKVVSVEAGGKPFPKDSIPEFTYTVTANGKATGKTPQGEYTATITVDPKKTPRTIENVHESGAQKGKAQYGIYKRDGDRWTVCMTRPGAAAGDRPKNFDTKDSANVVFVFERIKEAGKK